MNGRMVKSPEEIAYEGRLSEVLRQLEAVCPDFLLVTDHPGVKQANMFNRGIGWIHNLGALLANNPGVQKGITLALLQSYLIETKGPKGEGK
jgi:hypothetical protein